MRILIVDDEVGVVEFFRQAANSVGHSDIDVALTGEEAMTQAIRGTYDLITLDIKMPGASGLEILSLLRNLCPHAVIAIVSGHIPEDLSPDVSGCADVAIGKPAGLDSILCLMSAASAICRALDDVRKLGNLPSPCPCSSPTN